MADNEIFPLSFEQLTVISPHKLRDWWMRLRLPLPTRDPVLAWEAVRRVYEQQDALRLRLTEDAEGRARQLVLPYDRCPETDRTREPLILDAEQADTLTAPDPYRQVSKCAVLVGADGVEAELRVHHLGWDGWSGAVFARALRAAVNGDDLAAPTVCFRDHVRAQYRAGRELGADQRAYWSRILGDGAGAAAPSGTASSDTASSGETRRTDPVTLPHSVALAGAARAAWATPAALVIAALLRSLAAATGVTDRMVHLVHHGRDEPSYFPVVGFFARSIPLRVDTAAHRDLSSLARATMLLAVDGVVQSRPPFALYRLARDLGLPKAASGLGGTAQVEVTINLQMNPPAGAGARNGSGHPAGAPVLEPTNPLRPPTRPGKLWLLGSLIAGQLWAEYDPRRYPDALAAEVLNRAASMLAGAVGNA